MNAPWTDIGRVESDVSDIRNQLRDKVDRYELSSIGNDVSRAEQGISGLRSDMEAQLSELRDRVFTLEQGGQDD